jgi:methyltransferase
MTGLSPTHGTGLGLLLYFSVLLLERGFELGLSRRNAARMRLRGAEEYGRKHFPLFVVLHTLFPLALAWEVLSLGARPGPAWPVWLVALVLAQALRIGAIRALGEFWNVRIWVLPGAAPIRHGLYRWLRHPNYIAVVVEVVAGPMLFGAWRAAVLCSLLNAIALAIRIPIEERALDSAATRLE